MNQSVHDATSSSCHSAYNHHQTKSKVVLDSVFRKYLQRFDNCNGKLSKKAGVCLAVQNTKGGFLDYEVPTDRIYQQPLPLPKVIMPKLKHVTHYEKFVPTRGQQIQWIKDNILLVFVEHTIRNWAFISRRPSSFLRRGDPTLPWTIRLNLNQQINTLPYDIPRLTVADRAALSPHLTISQNLSASGVSAASAAHVEHCLEQELEGQGEVPVRVLGGHKAGKSLIMSVDVGLDLEGIHSSQQWLYGQEHEIERQTKLREMLARVWPGEHREFRLNVGKQYADIQLVATALGFNKFMRDQLETDVKHTTLQLMEQFMWWLQVPAASLPEVIIPKGQLSIDDLVCLKVATIDDSQEVLPSLVRRIIPQQKATTKSGTRAIPMLTSHAIKHLTKRPQYHNSTRGLEPKIIQQYHPQQDAV